LASGEVSEDSFIYEISDGRGGTAEATVLVTIIGVNDQPIAAKDRSQVTVGEILELDANSGLLSNDEDIDGDQLSVVSVNGDRLTGAEMDLASGAILFVLADGTITYTPPSSADLTGRGAGEISLDSFTYGVSDGQGGAATATVEITVINPNRPPIARDIGRVNSR
jgi:hypothetical protein